MPQDEKEDEDPKANSSAGIVVESLSNIRTVASLTIEEEKLKQFDEALVREDPHPIRTNAIKGSTGGLSQIVQMWGFGKSDSSFFVQGCGAALHEKISKVNVFAACLMPQD
jgi:hypothetical protein